MGQKPDLCMYRRHEIGLGRNDVVPCQHGKAGTASSHSYPKVAIALWTRISSVSRIVTVVIEPDGEGLLELAMLYLHLLFT